MTYNFVPFRWYGNHRDLLEARHRRGELDDDGLAEAIEELDRRHEEMTDRLDRAYVIPGAADRDRSS